MTASLGYLLPEFTAQRTIGLYRAVEVDHVDRLADREGLSEQQRFELRAYWLRRIEDPLRPIMDRLMFSGTDTIHRSRIARHLGHGFLFQL